ncbi:MAG: DUF1015 domain-containing protein [Acidimicrobiales bacterium]
MRGVPRFEPFPAIRYAPDTDHLAVIAPPYDVLTAADRAALAARSPHNIVRIDVPVDERYDQARDYLDAWRADATLVTDLTPTFSVYRMTFTDEAGTVHATTGVIGALELMRPGDGDVLPHERTTPKAKSDRLQLLRATDANTSAVWGLSLAKGLAALVEVDTNAEPLVDVVDEASVRHQLWRISAPGSMNAIAALVGSAPVVIADGHHRYDTCRTYREERRAGNGKRPGPYDLTLAFVVELAPGQLNVEAIHRLIGGLPPGTDVAKVLASHFELSPAGGPDASIVARMVERGALCLVHPDGTETFLTPRAGAFAGVADLDTSRLDAALAGIPHDLVFQHGVRAIVNAVTSGQAPAGVLLRPVPVATIEAFAHRRELMPPKSTFFAPKPKTGLVLRSLS